MSDTEAKLKDLSTEQLANIEIGEQVGREMVDNLINFAQEGISPEFNAHFVRGFPIHDIAFDLFLTRVFEKFNTDELRNFTVNGVAGLALDIEGVAIYYLDVATGNNGQPLHTVVTSRPEYLATIMKDFVVCTE